MVLDFKGIFLITPGFTMFHQHFPGAPFCLSYTHRIHGTGIFDIFAYMYHKNQPNVGKYTSPMDPMGIENTYELSTVRVFFSHEFFHLRKREKAKKLSDASLKTLCLCNLSTGKNNRYLITPTISTSSSSLRFPLSHMFATGRSGK